MARFHFRNFPGVQDRRKAIRRIPVTSFLWIIEAPCNGEVSLSEFSSVQDRRKAIRRVPVSSFLWIIEAPCNGEVSLSEFPACMIVARPSFDPIHQQFVHIALEKGYPML